MCSITIVMNNYAYNPSNHLSTILCNMAPQRKFANIPDEILHQIKKELERILYNLGLDVQACRVRHVVQAIKRLDLTKHTIMYKHEIYYLLTKKPRPVVAPEQETQIINYFKAHESDYKIKNNYYNFEKIIENIDKQLGFNIFADN